MKNHLQRRNQVLQLLKFWKQNNEVEKEIESSSSSSLLSMDKLNIESLGNIDVISSKNKRNSVDKRQLLRCSIAKSGSNYAATDPSKWFKKSLTIRELSKDVKQLDGSISSEEDLPTPRISRRIQMSTKQKIAESEAIQKMRK